ncbi:MAG: hypothetical protein NUV69_03250 [Candidatus Curtissbacteria bacterium]|nr:hypothetical protein [Candidatus Curtissbacteria bacterium]
MTLKSAIIATLALGPQRSEGRKLNTLNLGESIIATLAYHDLFDYPLPQDEIYRYLIEKKSSLGSVEKELANLNRNKKIFHGKSYYSLPKRSKIIKTRIQRTKHSEAKYKRALLYAKILKTIPFLKLVALSGALSMRNSQKDDDIDLVLVSKKGTLWTTRFLANTLLFNVKRNPQSPKTSNKACLNIFIDESSLTIKDQNIYIAHEICQMKPLWDRNETYSRFINSNQWIYKYMPNWRPQEMESGKWKMENHQSRGAAKKDSSLNTLGPQSEGRGPHGTVYHSTLVEILLKKFQLWYMKEKISTEKIGDKQLFFHPKDTQSWVITEYEKRLRKLP